MQNNAQKLHQIFNTIVYKLDCTLEQRLNASKPINVSLTQKRKDNRTLWKHNTMPLPVTLDPLECKNITRHLNGTNNKLLNNLQYNKTFTRSLFPRTFRTISSPFYSIPIEQNVYRYIHLYAC